MEKKTIVISAFPACGKTYAVKNLKDLKILDSDSSNFSWIYPDGLSSKIRNPEFPKNYIEHIKENIGKYDYIFVSSHIDVRHEMEKAGIEFVLVFPRKDLLDEWVGRCYRRENNGFPIEVLIDNWEKWIDSMESGCDKHDYYVLKHNEYLSNILPVTYNSNRKR